MTLQSTERHLLRVEGLARRLQRAYKRRVALADERIEAGADIATSRDFQILYSSIVKDVEEMLLEAWPNVEAWLEAGASSIDDLGPWECAHLLDAVPDDEWAPQIKERLEDLARGPIRADRPDGPRRDYDKGEWMVANLVLRHLEQQALATRR